MVGVQRVALVGSVLRCVLALTLQKDCKPASVIALVMAKEGVTLRRHSDACRILRVAYQKQAHA